MSALRYTFTFWPVVTKDVRGGVRDGPFESLDRAREIAQVYASSIFAGTDRFEITSEDGLFREVWALSHGEWRPGGAPKSRVDRGPPTLDDRAEGSCPSPCP